MAQQSSKLQYLAILAEFSIESGCIMKCMCVLIVIYIIIIYN